MARRFTNKILELVDEGLVDPRWLLIAALGYMSEAEVEEFYRLEGLDDLEEEYQEGEGE